MGRLRKKGEKGLTTMFISRTRAVRKLQLTLKDFRRLCILKGVYPREPPNYKKVGKGNPAKKTYYHAKDIQFLSHEPLIQKFREFKIFSRKLKKAEQKKEEVTINRLLANTPTFPLDHIVKERYPAFTDAVRDMDDALCMCFLFAEMSNGHKGVRSNTLEKCRPLVDEFTQYVIKTRSLQKVFLSIKGIYYQANVMGQTVTWITPYKFSMAVPTDVDYRIMDTFLTFYTTLVGFVNCKLYSTLNLHYPPKRDEERAKNDAGVSALIMESTDAMAVGADTAEAKQQKQSSKKRVASLGDAIAKIESDSEGEDEGEADDAAGEAGEAKDLDSFPAQMAGGEDTVAELAVASGAAQEADAFSKLFEGQYFFLSREVPRYALEFVIRSFGGHVSWQGLGQEDAVGRGPYEEDDKRITHHIIDRPSAKTKHIERHYIQPQWVFDCVNAHKLVPTNKYAIGAVLPPHLSPFVVADEDSYVPPEAKEAAKAEDKSEVPGGASGNDVAKAADDASEDEDDEEEEDDSDDEEELHRKELAEEQSGAKIDASAPKGKGKKKAAKGKGKKAQPEGEMKELAKSMMPKKDKKLYEAIMKKKDAKVAAADKLRAKRKAIDGEKTKKKRKKATN